MTQIMPAPTTPPLAADVVIELADRPGRPFVLVERKYEPYGWAIPGGFVEVGESVESAAVREAEEETALKVRLLVLLGVYSAPDRDPRGHTVSAVYVAEASGEPHAQDDALALAVFSPDRLPSPLVFDHSRILADYLTYRETGRLPTPGVPV